MASRFWVIGGDYLDDAFTQIQEGTAEEKLGPFDSYPEALEKWQDRSFATMDNCSRRYRIVEEARTEPVKRFWVIGGDYADQGFKELLPGAQEERLGPFESYKDAHEAWQDRSFATMDNCARRYRILEETSA
jgi:hypothetical protein